MSKVKIDKNDKNRILLTELLPYEVPMLFSNEGFYINQSSKNSLKVLDKIKSLRSIKYGIPFNYEIKKNISGSTRTLSIIHPLNQINFIGLYDKYSSLMIHLCSKSPFSLRKISRVAKYFYSPSFLNNEDPLKGTDREIDSTLLDSETKYLKSYFIYKPIDLIYKFYDRHELQRLEQRFNLLMKFDISKCFYNIYTHSITWAVKNKEIAKKNHKNDSFENSFDKIMQLANYNETNGIVVGPEISRIFAEIILQQIDLNVLDFLESEKCFKHGIDFEVKRYVDDFFVFSNDKNVLEEIRSRYQKELEFYKLYLNSSKDEIRETPFLSNIAVGKWEICKTLTDFFNFYIEEVEENTIKKHKFKNISSSYKNSRLFIKDFQCIVKRNGLTYDVLNKEVIRFFKKELVKILKDDDLLKDNNLCDFLLMFLDILFYAYSVNLNSNTTFKVSQIIVLMCNHLCESDEEFKYTIFSKIFKELDFVLSNDQRKCSSNDSNIEMLNLIIASKSLGNNYLFSEKRLRQLFSLNSSDDFLELNYFKIITLLYYLAGNINYEMLRSEVEKSVVRKFSKGLDVFSKSEYTLLFLDYICCPFVSLESKRKIMKSSKYSESSISEENIDVQINEISKSKRWFMDWDLNIDLEKVLKKKEWGSSY